MVVADGGLGVSWDATLLEVGLVALVVAGLTELTESCSELLVEAFAASPELAENLLTCSDTAPGLTNLAEIGMDEIEELVGERGSAIGCSKRETSVETRRGGMLIA